MFDGVFVPLLGIEVADLEDQRATQRVEIELLADDIEWTAFTREEPASTRLEIAIFGFTRGDPRQNEMLNEVRTLEGDDEPSRRRALYESVIEDTLGRLAVIDTRLVELREAGVGLGVADNNGTTPAHLAVDRGHADCLVVLREAGVDMSVANNYGDTPAHSAAGHPECKALLKEWGYWP